MRNKAKAPAPPPAPTTENGTVPPRRVRNAERRPREDLIAREVERLMAAARDRGGCYGHHDATLPLLAYRHGLRAGELVSLRWDQLDFSQGLFHVRRLKNGRPSVHILRGSELRALRRLQREQTPPSPYVFTTERRTPMTPAGLRKLLTRIGQAARTSPSPCTRTCCGTPAASRWPTTGTTPAPSRSGSGTKDIQHTTRYTELTSHRFRDFWERED